MSEIEDPAEEKRVAYMKAKREFAEALRVRSETERLNPLMVMGERAKPSLGERLKKNTDEMIEAKHAYDLSKSMFGNGGSESRSERPQVNQSNFKADILKAVIASGRSPEESAKLMEQLSPYLLAVDDPAAALLVSRLGNGGEKMTLKEILEIIQLTKNMQGSQSASDPAAMANAIVGAIRTGAELSSKNNGSDAGTIQSLYQQMTTQQQQSFDRHLELLRERYTDQPSFDQQLASVLDLQKRLGGLGKESESIALKRMNLEHERWVKAEEISADVRRSKSQSEMVRTITSGLQKALENPVLSELGKNVGRKIPGVGSTINAVSEAKTAAAQAEINNPLNVPYAFTCSKCHSDHRFTAGQLTMIEAQGGRWVCTGTINGEPCGELYEPRPGPTGGGA